jgi:two-component system sensor histidine kinase KdpD
VLAVDAAIPPKIWSTQQFWRLRGYGAGIGAVVLCTALSVASAGVLETAAFGLVFPLAVLAVTMWFGVGPALLTGALGIFAFDFIVVPPFMAFSALNRRDALVLTLMLAVALMAGALAERLRRREELAQAEAGHERLRNALLSALSHDLRSPLATLVGASAALDEGRVEPQRRNEFTRMVATEAAHLSRIVEALLALTRLRQGGLGPAQSQRLQAIDELIGASLDRTAPRLQGREIRTDVPEQIPLVPCDPVLVQQVLLNLIDNALRHGGDASPIEIVAREAAGKVLVEVSDRGPGVEPGDEERVFERLYRGRGMSGNDGGLGLGLTICRAIVSVHGGRIWLENRQGGGAKVSFTLPTGTDLREAVPS